ncbi:MAG: hypothetical protein A2Z91_07695 [Deltaproteobacteria bacterium GWA2_38_16]|nr:MAG: hypothetical protein A2Z91_07695 [Deltaproteobacteria bacterium GWA2_38_16]
MHKPPANPLKKVLVTGVMALILAVKLLSNPHPNVDKMMKTPPRLGIQFFSKISNIPAKTIPKAPSQSFR